MPDPPVTPCLLQPLVRALVRVRHPPDAGARARGPPPSSGARARSAAGPQDFDLDRARSCPVYG
jgi:hypothetical protein